ncbi:MAG: DNA polymerase III, subunit gamma and tau [Microbacterium sp. SCN 70-200]|uniref:DNA polymerase III subunit gamma and tau n=1 Tax=unclassified Microbacterium TaxID=2609290 RepID=UPI00086DEDDC|nr:MULTISPECIES: DNA polymerase III subunit gamma and tau [unclassified Microbacterium]MBN9213624.1 DNA polymerase III subunit gamma and tau [Microbacterium sp.]ODT42229.1 MAG: DNA polymerase III, subunit gamma and tau [Microbacterium sp. SCN 70-200]OJV79142.1 MAG: DNA polymerase III, subunit gamma and tau [Microbacterium sp. 70-16]
MTTALYRRYRPESFGEMIGQAQVTDPLMTALRGDRVGHAYLFSGPRGCGKTTSARILARCLNCAEGPTDTPCGKCDSCIELGRGGGGSLDVVEIDAASHNGVDDARDLRERAIFAPARDRFKIFILDEAHMVTPQGFNALLKLVEEPPDHVKFIFATTEPEKVIGTIRSRTHHYPFRLVAPAAMLEYVEQLCAQESVQVEPGVLPLVVRAGGGSPRDTLSLLDQLIAGSEDGVVRYERAVALLGYTHAELLDEVVSAFAAHNAGAAFAAVDRVVQTGQDPRRFVDDLLERLRDLIIVAATGDGAAAVLRGIPADELERMSQQARAFSTDGLSQIADLVVGTLDEMSGATSPRLQLELLVARVLAHTAGGPVASVPVDASRAPIASAAPVVAPAAPVAAPAAAPAATPAPQAQAPAAPPAATPAPAAQPPAAPTPAPAAQAQPASDPAPPAGPVTLATVLDSWQRILDTLEPISRTSWMLAAAATPVGYADDVLALNFQSQGDVAAFKKLAAGKGPSEDLRSAILAVLDVRVKYVARHDAGGQQAPQAPPAAGPGTPPAGQAGPGGTPASPAAGPGTPPAGQVGHGGTPPVVRPEASAPPRSSASAAAPVTEWAVAAIPADGEPGPVAQLAVDDEPEDAEAAPVRTLTIQREHDGDVIPVSDIPPDDEDDVPPPPDDDAPLPPRAPVAVERRASAAPPRAPRTNGIERVGEAVVRQVLGATFVREEPHNPPTRFN